MNIDGNGILLRDSGRLPPSTRKLLEKVGDEKITKIVAVRTPLASTTKSFLNIITLGQFEKISKKFFDEIFHLSFMINDKFNLEKNAVISFTIENAIKNNSETLNILVNKNINFNELFENTRKAMGNSNFSSYNAETNNCQVFLTAVLNSNKLGTDSDKKWIKQDTDALFKEIPTFSKIIGNLATTAGAVVDRVLQGEGRPRRLYITDDGRYFYLKNKKKKFVKMPPGISQKQVVKINLNNLVKPKNKRRRKRKGKAIVVKPSSSLFGVPAFQPLKKDDTNLLKTMNEFLLKFVTREPIKITPVVANDFVEPKSRNRSDSDATVEIDLSRSSSEDHSFGKSSNSSESRNESFARREGQREIDIPSSFGEDEFSTTTQIRAPRVSNVLDISSSLSGDGKVESNNFISSCYNPLSILLGSLPIGIEANNPMIKTEGFSTSTSKKQDETKQDEPQKKDEPQKQDGNGFVIKPSTMTTLLFGSGCCFHQGGGIDDVNSDVIPDGLYNTEIEKIAENLGIEVPVIASNEINKIINMIDHNTKEFGFIINTDTSNGSGIHWRAIFIDNDLDRPSIEYFDPLGDPPEITLIDDIKKIVNKLDNEKYFLFKENMIKRQADDTDTCGHFSLKFLEDRYNGVSWSDATGFKKCIQQQVEGERDIQKSVKKYESYL